MTDRVVVRESVISDVYLLAARLRDGDRDEVAAIGIDPREAIRRSFRDAILRRTYLVDGEIAAMSGLCGTMMSDIGEPFLLTAEGAERVPVAFVKCARTAVFEMLHHRRRLEGFVAHSYAKARRLLEVLGFTIDDPRPIGPKNAMFCRYWMVRHAIGEAR